MLASAVSAIGSMEKIYPVPNTTFCIPQEDIVIESVEKVSNSKNCVGILERDISAQDRVPGPRNVCNL